MTNVTKQEFLDGLKREKDRRRAARDYQAAAGRDRAPVDELAAYRREMRDRYLHYITRRGRYN